jgi:AI-2 transport protein TqsA
VPVSDTDKTKIGRAGSLLVVAAALVIVAAGVRFARPILVPLLLASLVATVTAPLVLMLERRRVPTGIAVTLAVLTDLAGIAVLGLVVGRAFVGIEARLPVYAEQLDAVVSEMTGRLVRYGVPESEITKLHSPATLVGLARDFAQGLAGVLSSVAVILIIVVFMLLEVSGFRRKFSLVFDSPAEIERVHRVAREVNKYLAVKLATSAATGISCGAWAAMLGLDFAVLWGLLAFILNFIPNIGSIVAAVPPLAVALVQLGVGSAVLVLAGYAAVNLVIGNIVEPRIMGRALGLSAVVVFFSVFLWGWLLGPVGALISVPLTMVAKITFETSKDLGWVATMMGEPPRPSSRPPGENDAPAPPAATP